ncbi:MAG: flagellar hook-basal body complex protein FliE [Thermoplasmata archaeon]|nr:flagellar hook-basal body complex protein FliE [Thermoplasmata archaeon]
MKAIAFTGMPGAGKSEAVKVAEEMGINVIKMGDVVRKEAKKKGLALTDENLGGLADEMRKKHGKEIWAKKCLEELKGKDIVVIDGIRNIEEVEVFRQHIKNFILVAIHASPKIRYERIARRRRTDDTESIEKMKEREKRELSWGLGDVIAMADIVIINEGDLEEFREKIKKLLKENET